MRYYIADPHFGDQSIIRFCGRPFADAEEMDAALETKWNARVTQADEVYVIGDMFGRGADRAADILGRLNGRKHLIIGNHDGAWMSKVDTGTYFESVSYMTEIRDGNRKVILCHYPVFAWRRGRKNYVAYGHIHNDTSQDFWPLIASRDAMLNACVEINGYMPVTLDELEANNAKFKRGEKKL